MEHGAMVEAEQDKVNSAHLLPRIGDNKDDNNRHAKLVLSLTGDESYLARTGTGILGPLEFRNNGQSVSLYTDKMLANQSVCM